MELKKCINCGEEIDKNAKFCMNCGTKQENEIVTIIEDELIVKEGIVTETSTIDTSNEQKEDAFIEEKECEKDAAEKKSKKGLLIGVIIAVLIAIIAFYFISTSESRNYEKANALFEQQKYQEALAIYEKLEDYEDSTKLAKKCKKEIGMRKNADYDFLDDIESSILSRMETSTILNQDFEQMVDTELAYLEKYEEKKFYDNKLKKLAKRYLKGLRTQKEALKAEYGYEEQIEWQRGLVIRKEVLCELNSSYQFLDDNSEFMATYINNYQEDKNKLKALESIDKDVGKQSDKMKYDVDFYDFGEGADVSFKVKNNTKYTYDALYEFKFTTEKNMIFYNNNTYIENVKPGESYVVSVYVDLSECDTDKFYWEWYVDSYELK